MKPPLSKQPVAKKKGGKSRSRQGKAKFSREDLHMIKGCVDPFSDCAVGCKLVSSDSSRTFTYTVRGKIGAITTDANGAAAAWAHPGIINTVARHDTITAGVVTWLARGNVPEAASLQGIAGKYRIVCAGVHIFASCNTDEAKGIVSVTTGNYGTSPTPSYNIDSYSYEEVYTDSLFGFDRVFGFRRLSPAQVANFEDITITEPHSGWNSITVSVSGGTASTSVLNMEYIWHIELQPDPISIGSRLADPPKPVKPGLELATANVNKELPFGSTKSGWSSVVETLITPENILSLGSYALGML